MSVACLAAPLDQAVDAGAAGRSTASMFYHPSRRSIVLSLVAAGWGGASTARSAGSLGAPYIARDARLPWSLIDFGPMGVFNTDHTRLIQKSISSGEKVISCPSGIFNVEDTITFDGGSQKFFGSGPSTVFICKRPPRSPAIPLMLVTRDAPDCQLSGFVLKAAGSDKSNPKVGKGDVFSVPYGSALVVCGDRVRISDIDIHDAWDNGVALVGAPFGGVSPGVPADPLIRDVRTFNCGCGDHTIGGPGRIGSGINILSASNASVIGCIDHRSNGAVTFDDGAGANGRVIGCSGFENPRNGTGVGASFYTGANEVQFVGCQSFFPGSRGFWLNASADIVGGLVVGADDAGLHITGDNCTIADVTFKNIGFRKRDNDAVVVRVDAIYRDIKDVMLRNVRSWSSTPNLPAYGYYEVPGRKNSAHVNLTGRLIGRLADYKTNGASQVPQGANLPH